MRITLFVLLCLGACSGKDGRAPGTSVGTFRVEGKKQSATCGDAASAPDPWIFDVRFSRDQTTLYWVQNRAPVGGRIGSDRKVKLQTSETILIRSADRLGNGRCTVTRTDTLEAMLGPDEPLGDAGSGGFSSLAGTLSYAFASEPGSDCTGIMDPALSVLPCSTVYAVEARKTGP